MITQVVYNLIMLIAFSVLIIYLISRIRKVVSFIKSDNVNGFGIIFTICVLGIIIMAASKFAITISGAKTNIRDSITVIAAIVGGPVAGIIVGIIGAVYRYTLGGWTTMGCCTATLLSGIISSIIVHYTKFRPNKINVKNALIWTCYAGVWQVIHVLVLVPSLGQKPFAIGFNLMFKTLLGPIAFMNMFTVFVVLIAIKDVIVNDSRSMVEEQKKLIENLRLSKNEVSNLSIKIESAAEELESTSQKLSNVSSTTLVSAGEAAKSIEQVASKSDDQSKSMNNYVQMFSKLSENLTNILKSAENMEHLSHETKKHNEESLKTVKLIESQAKENEENIENVSERIDKLNEKSNMIGKVVDTINSIATQTNLLALNAAIESARAGEAGKGFSVVADEVRKLAEQTSVKAEEVSKLVKDIQSESLNVSKASNVVKNLVLKQSETIESSETIFDDINKAILEISKEIDIQTAALQKIDDNKNQITSEIENVSTISKENHTNSYNALKTVKGVVSTIKDLTDLSVKINDCLKEIKKSN